MTDDITLTVSREDLERVLSEAQYESGIVDRIRAAIPQPTWEPSDEMVKAGQRAWVGAETPTVVAELKRLHAAGIDMTLRDDLPRRADGSIVHDLVVEEEG